MPENFLEVRVHRLDFDPTLSGLCVGYELGEWRAEQFVDHLIEWLPEFALTYSELEAIDSANAVAQLREAFRRIYTSEKFEKRGEFGEVMLHAAIRQVFDSVPAVSKIYYKSALNETVKGFDAVHVVVGDDGLEIWLGEVKFYKSLTKAIYDVVEELKSHTERNYLKDEFMLISGKVDSSWPHADDLKALISKNTSLDDVFKKVRIPVLLTYDSDCVNACSICDANYIDQFQQEVIEGYTSFSNKDLPENVTIHLFLLPLKSKEKLVEALDVRLKGLQKL